MKNSQSRLKTAIKRTAAFMLNIDVETSARVPEWYEQIALSAEHQGLTSVLYDELLDKLKQHLNAEYGHSAATFLLR